MNKSLCYFTIVALLTLYACEDPTTIGSGLLQDEEISLNSESNFEISSTTIQPGPIPSFIWNNTNFSSFNLGSYSDPIFGEINSKVVFKLEYNFNEDIPNLSGIYIDSVVLAIAFDSLSGYGNLSALHDIKVFEITDIPTDDTIFSNTVISYNESPIAESTFAFTPRDSVFFQDYLTDTITRKLAPQLRIHLDTTRFLNLFADFEAINTSAEFQEKFKGIVITSDSKGAGLMGLNLGSTTSDATNGVNGLSIYYRSKTTNAKSVARLIFSLQKLSLFSNDFAASPNAGALNNPEIGKERLFLQGLNGPNVVIKFEDIQRLQGKVINHAELEITPEYISGDDLTLYPFVKQLILTYKKDNTIYTISDITDLSTPGIGIETGFGGNLVERSGTPNGSYKMIVTKALKAMLKGDVPNNELTISPLISAQRANRVVLYGAKHPQYPIKLKVAYTNP